MPQNGLFGVVTENTSAEQSLKADVVDGDVVEADVVEGDVIEGDVIEGDVIEGDVIEGLPPHLSFGHLLPEGRRIFGLATLNVVWPPDLKGAQLLNALFGL